MNQSLSSKLKLLSCKEFNPFLVSLITVEKEELAGMVREAGAGESPTFTAADTNEEESAV